MRKYKRQLNEEVVILAGLVLLFVILLGLGHWLAKDKAAFWRDVAEGIVEGLSE